MTKQEFEEAKNNNETFKAACEYANLPIDFNYEEESYYNNQKIKLITAFLAGSNFEIRKHLEGAKQELMKSKKEREAL